MLKDILLVLLIACIAVAAISLIFVTIYTFKHNGVKAKEQQMIRQQAIQDYIKEMNKEND